VTGGSDLLQHFALRTHYDALQKQPPPEYVAQSGYLKKPVGDTALRSGEGMQLGQLLDPNWSGMASETTSIAPLGLEALRGAFTFRGEEPIELAQVRQNTSHCTFVDRGWPIVVCHRARCTFQAGLLLCLQQTASTSEHIRLRAVHIVQKLKQSYRLAVEKGSRWVLICHFNSIDTKPITGIDQASLKFKKRSQYTVL
jgi:hypothetical protein